MTEQSGGWRERAEAMRAQPGPDAQLLDAAYWQERLDEQYAVDMMGLQGAAWSLALQHLVQYGGARCHNTDIFSRPGEGPLSTGLLMLEAPRQTEAGTTMAAIRLSPEIYPSSVAKELPLDEVRDAQTIRRAHKRTAAAAAAVAALEGMQKLHIVKLEVYTLATHKAALSNSTAMRAGLREASLPGTLLQTFAQSGSPSRESYLLDLLKRRPEVALWSEPLGLFGESGILNYFYIRRPAQPKLEKPQHETIENYMQAVQHALQAAQKEQEHLPEVLDMLTAVTEPVRNLGAQAIVSLKKS